MFKSTIVMARSLADLTVEAFTVMPFSLSLYVPVFISALCTHYAASLQICHTEFSCLKDGQLQFQTPQLYILTPNL